MKKLIFIGFLFLVIACSNDNDNTSNDPNINTIDLSDYFNINFNLLPNYSDQYIPVYITKDNSQVNNTITNEGATLGRVLFYDVNLSIDNSISCASCHKQEFAFGDDNAVSIGVDGVTARHSMRLVNARFANEEHFFWDERANSLEEQTTMPIQDHIEMGFSGENGDLGFADLIDKLEGIEYYPELFNLAFGSTQISESRIQNALAQFVRSIQSFDSKYDEGRVFVENEGQDFPNFTAQENIGKNLFMEAPIFDNMGSRIAGGIGCKGCHQAPEFDIDPNSLNNGVVGLANGIGSDFTVTRAPTIRDIVKPNGDANGPFMHIGVSTNLMTVLNHYDNITIAGNTNLDPRLRPGGNPQQLNLTQQEKNAVIAFIQTLGGQEVYTNSKWSNPFID